LYSSQRAHALIHQHRSFDKAIRRVRLDGKVIVPPGYERDFELAFLTFNHQRVYDPLTKTLVHLTEPQQEFHTKFADSSFLGPSVLSDNAVPGAAVVDEKLVAHFAICPMLCLASSSAISDELACGIAEGRLDPDTHQPFAIAPIPSHFAPNATSTVHSGAAVAAAANATLGPPPPPHENYVAPERAMDGSLPAFERKRDKHAQHQQQLSISAMFPRHPHQYAAAAAAAASAGAHSAAARSTHAAAVLNEKQQKIFNAVGALLEGQDPSASAALLVPLSSELKRDFRPPRRSDTAAAARACKDVTNTLSQPEASSSTPARSSSLFSHTRPPNTFPQKAVRVSSSATAAERLSFFEQYAFGASRSAPRPTIAGSMLHQQRGSSDYYPAEDGDDEYGFARTDAEAEAEAELEAAAAAADAEEEEEDDGDGQAEDPESLLREQLRRAPRRPNFLQRSSTGGGGVSRLASSSSSSSARFFSPPSNTPRAELFSPPAGASPSTAVYSTAAPHPLSPSPSPPPPQSLHTPTTASKYFSSAPRASFVRRRHPTDAAASISALAPPAQPLSRAQTVPDACSFLHAPGMASIPASARLNATAAAGSVSDPSRESDGEGRISDMDDAALLDETEADVELHAHIAATRKRARSRAGRTAAAAAASANVDDATAAKRFKSPLVSSARISLPLSSAPAPAFASSHQVGAIDFDRFVRRPSIGTRAVASSAAAAGEQQQVARSQQTPSPSPSPSPPPTSMLLQSSAAAAQPFRPLSVTSHTASARFTVPAARPPASSQLLPLAFDVGVGYSSPPSDMDDVPETPPSPTPSPRANPSPMSSSSLSPSPPVVSAPYVAHAAAGFSSQPEDAELDFDDEQQQQPPQSPRPPLPSSLAPQPSLAVPMQASSFFAQFRYTPAASSSAQATAASRVAISS
jgi:hypothetical protein